MVLEAARSLEEAPEVASPTPLQPDAEKQHVVSAMEIFQDLDEATVQELMAGAPASTAKKGTVFYHPDRPPEALFLLTAGRIEIYRETPDGRRLTMATISPGTFFGAMALVDQSLRGTCAVAVEDSLLIALSRHDLEALIGEYPSVGMRMIEVLARRLEETRTSLQSFVFGDVLGRVSGLLLRLSDDETQAIEGYSHQELASMVGCLRETFTEALSRLKQSGEVEVGRKWIHILEKERLRHLAAQNTSLR